MLLVLSYNETSQDKDEEDFPLNLENSFNSKLPPGILTHGLPNPEFVAPAQTEIEVDLKDEVEGRIYKLCFFEICIYYLPFQLKSYQKNKSFTLYFRKSFKSSCLGLVN